VLTSKIYNTSGEETGEIELSEEIFGAKVNPAIVHEVVVSFLGNLRHGTHSTKTRTEVRGGGIKPWRQKGTGRARQGSIRAPQWTGGGIVFGPKPRSYRTKVNKKVKIAALKSVLTSKFSDSEIVFLEDFSLENYKTKEMLKILKNLGISGKILLVLSENDKIIVNSTRNIEGANVSHVGALNTYEILDSKKCIVTRSAVRKLEEVYLK
jgi:large subunit ribosomal protein L4